MRFKFILVVVLATSLVGNLVSGNPDETDEGGLPPTWPGKDGGGLPPTWPGKDGGGLPPTWPGKDGGGLPPSWPGKDGGGLPPTWPGKDGGGIPPIWLRQLARPPSSPALPLTERCHGSADPGPCRAAFPRYFYDPATNSCKRFTYGGCMGNANNFVSEDECLRSCMRERHRGKLPLKPLRRKGKKGKKPCWWTKKRCVGERVVGPCRAAIPRFYYDETSNSCRPFTYGGCGRNNNHWVHQKNCEKVCLEKNEPSVCRTKHGRLAYIPPKKRHCAVRKCPRRCPLGYKEDRKGCHTCSCVPPKRKGHHHRHHHHSSEKHLAIDFQYEK